MLKNKNIIIGVTGGIAAYKIPFLVRELKKTGANIRIVMTEAAKEFVTPLTLSTLSGHEVVAGMFPRERANVLDASTWHIDLAQWGNVMLIAPATANVLAKLAHGDADNTVTTLALALRCPLIVAPAMDLDMWQHATTQENINKLREMGTIVLPPEKGELASGMIGPGRLPDSSVLFQALEDVLQHAREDLEGKKILITAGPTLEAIDPVRYIGNRSSGKMGFAVANAAAQRGAEVTLISGRTYLPTPRNVRRVDVESAAELHRAVMQHRKKKDAIIMTAAVADFTPVRFSGTKIKKEDLKGDTLTIELRKTKDILQDVSLRNDQAVLVGFALETDHGLPNARKKLREKKLDFVLLNNPLVEGAGFDCDTNIVTILSKNGKVEKLPKMPKLAIAHHLLDRISRQFK